MIIPILMGSPDAFLGAAGTRSLIDDAWAQAINSVAEQLTLVVTLVTWASRFSLQEVAAAAKRSATEAAPRTFRIMFVSPW